MSLLLTAGFGVMSALVGAVLFVAPDWAAGEFPWNVSAFVAMTMGGWCLGNAFVAWIVLRNRRWATSYALLVYLWTFAVLETLVVLWFRDKLRLGGALSWPYLAMLAAGVAAAGRGAVEAVRLRPFPPADTGAALGRGVRNAVLVFVVVVAFLGVFGLLATGFGSSRRVFPEPLSPFTLRAFAVFYLALAIGAATLLPSRLGPTLTYARGGMGLIVPITVAALVYIGRFDFSAHPLQSAYIGAYLLVAAAVVVVLLATRGGRR